MVQNPFSSTPLLFSNLLHVPNSSKNMISVSKFAADNNLFFEFHLTTCVVKCQDTHRVLLQGIAKDGLYQFNNLTLLPSIRHPSSSTPSTLSISSSASLKKSSPLSVGTWHSNLATLLSQFLNLFSLVVMFLLKMNQSFFAHLIV